MKKTISNNYSRKLSNEYDKHLYLTNNYNSSSNILTAICPEFMLN
nr:MAG TPA: hypothetical protein [Crassvirales sp.]